MNGQDDQPINRGAVFFPGFGYATEHNFNPGGGGWPTGSALDIRPGQSPYEAAQERRDSSARIIASLPPLRIPGDPAEGA